MGVLQLLILASLFLNVMVHLGHVLDWSASEKLEAPWTAQALQLLQASGLRNICCDPCPILDEDCSSFYQHVSIFYDRFVAIVQGVEVVISVEVIQSVFHLPLGTLSLPVLSKNELMAPFAYAELEGVLRRYPKKMGFNGMDRFLAFFIGKCMS